MSLDDAVELVKYAFENAYTGDIMVQKAPACTVGNLAQALCEIFEIQPRIHIIGIRHGEKMHETLLRPTAQLATEAIDQVLKR